MKTRTMRNYKTVINQNRINHAMFHITLTLLENLPTESQIILTVELFLVDLLGV